jgi:hypothetical protein
MSDNFPEKNIADKLTQLADAFRGITPGSIRFPDNYPGKRMADKIDELIAVVREGEVIGDYDKLKNKPAVDGVTLDKDTASADVGLATLRQVDRIRALIGGEPGGELEYLELPAENLIDEANKLLHQIGDIMDLLYPDLVTASNEVEAKADANAGGLAAETAAREAYDQEQDAKLQALNGHYYPLDGYDFGKSLDVKTPNPDDTALLTTYAMTMEGASDPSEIIEDTVIKNEYDGVEFVWNAAGQVWTDWGIGNIVTASNEHLGVVKGNSQTGDGNVSVKPDGSMKMVDYGAVWDNIVDLGNFKQGNIPAGNTDVLLGPDTNGGSPNTRPLSDFQMAIPSGNTNILLGPTTIGGNPNTKPLAELQTAINAGNTNVLLGPNTNGGNLNTKPLSDFQSSIVAASNQLLTAPVTTGGQPGNKPMSDYQSSIPAGSTNVLLGPSTDGGNPTTKPLSDFVQKSVPLNSIDKTTTPIIIQNNNPGNYNQGIRINIDSGRWAGIIFGGRPNTKDNVDSVGYSSDQTIPATRNGTWWIASNPDGDLVLSQTALNGGSQLQGLLIKRNGRAYISSSGVYGPATAVLTPDVLNIEEFKKVLYANQLYIPSTDTSTAAANPFFYSSPNYLVLTVNTSLRLASLTGFLQLGANFTGAWDITAITIPKAYLPLNSYVMANSTLNSNNVNAPAILPVCSYFNPSGDGSGNQSMVWRLPPIESGKYKQVFINASWYY